VNNPLSKYAVGINNAKCKGCYFFLKNSDLTMNNNGRGKGREGRKKLNEGRSWRRGIHLHLGAPISNQENWARSTRQTVSNKMGGEKDGKSGVEQQH
jgi:hypothetical protein